MVPAQHNLRIVRGDDFLVRFGMAVSDAQGVRSRVDLTGWSVEAKLTDRQKLPDLSLTAVVTDAQDGVIDVSLAAAATVSLPDRNCNWYLALIDPQGHKQTYLAGDALPITRGRFK